MADHYERRTWKTYLDMDAQRWAAVGRGGCGRQPLATAALMLAAPVLLDLSRAGKLGCDVWLVHLRARVPGDCLGARHLCQCLLEGTCGWSVPRAQSRSVAHHRPGRYVLDMIAHNNGPCARRVPDLSRYWPRVDVAGVPGSSGNRIWNELAPTWNQRASRRADVWPAQPRRRTVPEIALHPRLSGEIRPPYDPRSTLFNTDGQIFSDAGVPVVLFMEDYDINRQGYHDTHDTLENIDLDYGAAVAAIAIESVVRAANETPPRSPR